MLDQLRPGSVPLVLAPDRPGDEIDRLQAGINCRINLFDDDHLIWNMSQRFANALLQGPLLL